MESGTCSSIGKKPQITEVLDETNEALSNLEKSIAELRDRLTPISVAIPIGKDQEKPSDRPRCTIDSCIKGIIDRINEQSTIINLTRQELQI